jgi:diguanylate cyclase (GGDEF)-like protein
MVERRSRVLPRTRDVSPVRTTHAVCVFATRRARRLLAAASACLFGLIYLVVLTFERPGLGTGHLFYLAILLLALSGGPMTGAVGGVVAGALYATALWLNPTIPAGALFAASTSIRLAMFVVVGASFGWFARGNRSAVTQLRTLAERDHLTGLLNTRGFDAALAGRRTSTDEFVLLLGDLDSLKLINDTLGHAAGDQAIKDAADRLARSLRADDVLARVGGDEFAALVSAPVDARELAERLEQSLAEQGSPLSLGWAVYPAESADTFELARIADKRLYERKALVAAGRRDEPRRLAVAD